MKYTEDIYK